MLTFQLTKPGRTPRSHGVTPRTQVGADSAGRVMQGFTHRRWHAISARSMGATLRPLAQSQGTPLDGTPPGCCPLPSSCERSVGRRSRRDHHWGRRRRLRLGHTRPRSGHHADGAVGTSRPQRGHCHADELLGSTEEAGTNRRNPSVALAYHAREHGDSDSPLYVLVQGTATMDERPNRAWLESITPEWEHFLGPRHGGPIGRLLDIYYWQRLAITVQVRRIMVYDGTSAPPRAWGGPSRGRPSSTASAEARHSPAGEHGQDRRPGPAAAPHLAG